MINIQHHWQQYWSFHPQFFICWLNSFEFYVFISSKILQQNMFKRCSVHNVSTTVAIIIATYSLSEHYKVMQSLHDIDNVICYPILVYYDRTSARQQLCPLIHEDVKFLQEQSWKYLKVHVIYVSWLLFYLTLFTLLGN
jgi:arginine exporter protein ArgO